MGSSTTNQQRRAPPDTYDVLIDKLQRYDRMILMIAAALLALIGTLAAGALKTSHHLFTQIAYTFIFLSGAVLALARSTFDKHASVLRRDLQKHPHLGSTTVPQRKRPSPYLRLVYRIGLGLTCFAGVCILAGIWCPVGNLDRDHASAEKGIEPSQQNPPPDLPTHQPQRPPGVSDGVLAPNSRLPRRDRSDSRFIRDVP